MRDGVRERVKRSAGEVDAVCEPRSDERVVRADVLGKAGGIHDEGLHIVARPGEHLRAQGVYLRVPRVLVEVRGADEQDVAVAVGSGIGSRERAEERGMERLDRPALDVIPDAVDLAASQRPRGSSQDLEDPRRDGRCDRGERMAEVHQ